MTTLTLKQALALQKRVLRAASKLEDLERVLKADCPHPTQTLWVKNDSDTGNYCRQDDKYWVDIRCPVCDSWFWGSSNGSPEEIAIYRNPLSVSKDTTDV